MDNDEESIEKLEVVKKSMVEASDQMFIKFQNEMKDIKHGERAIDAQKLWKMKKQFCPNVNDPPSAMLDSHGNLLTSDEDIKN